MGTIRESFAGEKVSLVKGVIPSQCGGNVRVSGQKGTAAVSGGGRVRFGFACSVL